VPGSNNANASADQLRSRVVWLDDLPHLIHEEDGVVRFLKMHIVPDVFWDRPDFRKWTLPDWAVANDLSPAEQFLALLAELGGRQQEAVAELRTITANLRAARSLIAVEASAEVIEPRIADLERRVGRVSKALDP
jgi:hypothetical protein